MATLSETFDTADSDTLGPVLSWTEESGDIDIVSNKARIIDIGDNHPRARAPALSTAHHSAQVVVRSSSATEAIGMGVMCRKHSSTATKTYYLFDLEFLGDEARAWRVEAGAFTSLSSSVATTAAADTDYTVKLSTAGSRFLGKIDGVTKFNFTDTGITGNLHTGFTGSFGALAANNDFNDFTATDLEEVFHRAAIAGTGATTTNVTLVIPASTVANDVVYAAFTNGGATADPSVVDNEGAGTWTKLLSGNNGTSNLSVWWKRASANTAGKTITASGFTNSCTGVAVVNGGVILTGNPYGGETYESNISGNETHAAITPTVNGSMICLVVGQAPDIAVSTQAATSPAVLVERAEHLSTGGLDSAVCFASEVQETAGSTGALTWAQTNQASMSIAFYIPPEVAVAADPKTPYPWQQKGQFAVHMAH
jgi:hypothetical protein